MRTPPIYWVKKVSCYNNTGTGPVQVRKWRVVYGLLLFLSTVVVNFKHIVIIMTWFHRQYIEAEAKERAF